MPQVTPTQGARQTSNVQPAKSQRTPQRRQPQKTQAANPKPAGNVRKNPPPATGNKVDTVA